MFDLRDVLPYTTRRIGLPVDASLDMVANLLNVSHWANRETQDSQQLATEISGAPAARTVKAHSKIAVRRCKCGVLLRPDVVWCGESLIQDILEAARAAAARCHTMLVIGASAVVQPAASLPLAALQNGARLVEVAPAETPLSAHAHEILSGPAAEQLPEWWEAHLRTST